MIGEVPVAAALGPRWRERSWEAPARLGRAQKRLFLTGGLAMATLATTFVARRDAQFFAAYLVAYLFWLSIALGCLAISMLHHLSRGAWGLPVRRVLEAGARTLPLMAVLFVPLLFGLPELYPWARPETVAADELLRHKSAYLNVPFFIGRAALYFLLWGGFAWILSRLSRRQDATGDPRLARRMQLLAAPGVGLYCLAATFASFDWLMSLDPHWSSTLYGVYFVGGHGLSGFAFLILVALVLARREPMADALGRRHFHDWGKLMFAFVMLWAYFGFSQFLIIWSANLPTEIGFYRARLAHGWRWVALALVVGHFALPFAVLLSRGLKRRPGRLAAVAGLVLAMRWVDLYWQAAPTLHPERVAPYPLDLVAFAAIGGVWLGAFVRELRRRPLLPLGAPGLEEALGDE